MLVVEKPFQPKWSNSLGIRRKIGRPGAQAGPRNGLENNTNSVNLQQQQQRRPPPPAAAIGLNNNDEDDGWASGNSASGEPVEHKIVHLTSRPTQLYYFHREGPELNGDTVELGSGQVCRVKVPSNEIFYIAYEDGAGSHPSVDLFFHCSQYWAWCCGVDCCQIDPTLLLGGLCILILALIFFVHLCLRSKLGQRFCLKLFRRRKRVIARANAQRRKRSENSSQLGGGGGEMRRIKVANSLKEKASSSSKKGHKKLTKTTTKEGWVMTTTTTTSGSNNKGIPEIVITEPSSCYEPSCRSGSEIEEEEDEEEFYED